MSSNKRSPEMQNTNTHHTQTQTPKVLDHFKSKRKSSSGECCSILFMHCKSMCSVINVPWFMCTYAKVCSFLCLSSFSFFPSLSLSLSFHASERKKLFCFVVVVCEFHSFFFSHLPFCWKISTHFISHSLSLSRSMCFCCFCCCVHSLLLATLTLNA